MKWPIYMRGEARMVNGDFIVSGENIEMEPRLYIIYEVIAELNKYF